MQKANIELSYDEVAKAYSGPLGPKLKRFYLKKLAAGVSESKISNHEVKDRDDPKSPILVKNRRTRLNLIRTHDRAVLATCVAPFQDRDRVERFKDAFITCCAAKQNIGPEDAIDPKSPEGRMLKMQAQMAEQNKKIEALMAMVEKQAVAAAKAPADGDAKRGRKAKPADGENPEPPAPPDDAA